MKKILTMLAAVLMLAACGSHKQLVKDSTTPATTGKPTAITTTTPSGSNQQATQLLTKLMDSQVKAANIVASANFRIVSGSKDLECDGTLRMRRNEIIRMQLLLPIIRTEIARVDFTPDYVLLVDRFHKEYIKASYSDVSFLADNGLSFYSLQALFWNQLFAPGENTLTESALRKFTAKTTGNTAEISLSHTGINYKWTADATKPRISRADISYNSAKHGTSSLAWTYDLFTSIGGQMFPTLQQFDVATTATGKQQQARLTIKMGTPKTSADWDVKTELSSKYKKIEAQDILKKLLSIQ